MNELNDILAHLRKLEHQLGTIKIAINDRRYNNIFDNLEEHVYQSIKWTNKLGNFIIMNSKLSTKKKE